MRRVLYIDAFNGVAGDMFVGALLDLGVPLEHLEEQLGRLPLKRFELRAEPVERQGLRGVDFGVVAAATPHGHHHDEESEGHAHAPTWAQIRELLESSELADSVRTRAVAVFQRLAEAEAKVHGTTVDEVHFHEVGAVDSIVDIVGACLGFDFLQIDECYSSALSLGGGTVEFSHGRWPVPAPATVEILRGLPTRMGPVDVELTTPTGAAIVATLSNFERPPEILLDRSGFGAGDRELDAVPNMLRLMLGRRPDASSDGTSTDPALPRSEEIVLLEATIDDMEAETFGHVLELALEAGALEVFHTAVQMKKSRPGVQLSVLCRPEDRHRLARLIFRETTTLGLRESPRSRWVLDRETIVVPTEWGPVRVKAARLEGEVVNLAPEYDDLKKIARASGRPLKGLRQMVLAEAARLNR